MASASTLPVSQVRSVLIVGAGLAGLRTAQALRGRGFSGEITVVGAETHAPYDRPPLSKHLFDNDSPVFLSSDIGADLYALADQVLLGRRVVDMVPQSSGWRVVSVPATSSDGGFLMSDEPAASQHTSAFQRAGGTEPETMAHLADAVVLALGAAPTMLRGLETALTLHTWDDAHHLRTTLTSLSEASSPVSADVDLLIIGAGWIGVELATVARTHGISVSLVEAASTPLERHLGMDVGARIKEWIIDNEVEFLADSQVRTVEPDVNGISRVLVVNHTGDTYELTARAVVSAIGARPTTAWLPDYIATGAHGAVLTDPSGRVHINAEALPASTDPTQLPLYAVGDCAVREDAVHGHVTGGHWAVALNDPELIARDITGSDTATRAVAPHVFSTQFQHDLNLFGTPDLKHDTVVFRDYPDGSWTALYVRPHDTQLLVNAVFTVDAPRDASQARKLTANGSFSITASNVSDLLLPLKSL